MLFDVYKLVSVELHRGDKMNFFLGVLRAQMATCSRENIRQ